MEGAEGSLLLRLATEGNLGVYPFEQLEIEHGLEYSSEVGCRFVEEAEGGVSFDLRVCKVDTGKIIIETLN